MALRDKMRDSAAPYLRPGETVQAVFGAQTEMTRNGVIGAVIFFSRNEYRMIVVTTERLLVLNAGRLSMARAKGLVAEMPRPALLSPQKGAQCRMAFDGEQVWVRRKFRKDIEAANGAAPLSARSGPYRMVALPIRRRSPAHPHPVRSCR